jgi:hypothetical protein
MTWHCFFFSFFLCNSVLSDALSANLLSGINLGIRNHDDDTTTVPDIDDESKSVHVDSITEGTGQNYEKKIASMKKEFDKTLQAKTKELKVLKMVGLSKSRELATMKEAYKREQTAHWKAIKEIVALKKVLSEIMDDSDNDDDDDDDGTRCACCGDLLTEENACPL